MHACSMCSIFFLSVSCSFSHMLCLLHSRSHPPSPTSWLMALQLLSQVSLCCYLSSPTVTGQERCLLAPLRQQIGWSRASWDKPPGGGTVANVAVLKCGWYMQNYISTLYEETEWCKKTCHQNAGMLWLVARVLLSGCFKRFHLQSISHLTI